MTTIRTTAVSELVPQFNTSVCEMAEEITVGLAAAAHVPHDSQRKRNQLSWSVTEFTRRLGSHGRHQDKMKS